LDLSEALWGANQTAILPQTTLHQQNQKSLGDMIGDIVGDDGADMLSSVG